MSSNTHLRPQGGGDPARSNSKDLENDPKEAQLGNDFPDAPGRTVDDSPQDKPDLDAFAKRMGTDTIQTGENLDAVPQERSADSTGDSRLIIAGGGAVVALLLLIVFRRRKQRGLMSKVVALGAAAHVVRV